MELEREKGITIKSAATYCKWGTHHINIIDTPGHVDFTVEVERSLRVLDGAVLVLCGVGGVQSQTYTVDRQMKRYNVPRICFINKLDRLGADPFRVYKQLKEKLMLHSALVQIPMGLEDNYEGVIDLVDQKAVLFNGTNGEKIEIIDIPERFMKDVTEKRKILLEALADVDPVIEEMFLEEKEPSNEEIKAAIRRSTLAMKFAPIFCGSAKRNSGVQTLLDGVINYLPAPYDRDNYGFEKGEKDKKILVVPNFDKSPVVMAFKLEDGKYGQLTYIRIYQGLLKKGDNILNMNGKKKLKVLRLVRCHSDEIEDIKQIGPGEICAMFGVECSSGDTFVGGTLDMTMESMFIPKPVISMSVSLKDRSKEMAFAKCLNRFQREDPTFRVSLDPESNQTVMHGMGELHLQIHLERMKREYDCDVIGGKPYVAYRETINKKTKFDYLHKKQSGGSGQYARVMGYIEPMDFGEDDEQKFEFSNQVMGNSIPPGFITACEKGFLEVSQKGPLLDSPVWGVRVVLQEGVTHPVDSSELAFKTACWYAFRNSFMQASPVIIEPIMKCEVSIPSEYQGSVVGGINRRRGAITGTDEQGGFLVIYAEVPLGEMFGYMTELRSLTQGKGEFSMEYKEHRAVEPFLQSQLVTAHKETKKVVEPK